VGGKSRRERRERGRKKRKRGERRREERRGEEKRGERRGGSASPSPSGMSEPAVAAAKSAGWLPAAALVVRRTAQCAQRRRLRRGGAALWSDTVKRHCGASLRGDRAPTACGSCRRGVRGGRRPGEEGEGSTFSRLRECGDEAARGTPTWISTFRVTHAASPDRPSERATDGPNLSDGE
jgi:hypothetical protein